MIVFAIELSTVRASVAICDDDCVLAEASWIEPRARHQRIFAETPRLLKDAGLDWPQIDLFAVGRGPGAFSGIRIGLMAAQMFAMPLNKPVIAVSSGEALASEIDADKVAICGDARRGMFWFAVCEDRAMGAWKLCNEEDFASKIPSAAIVATPHWNQIVALRDATKDSHRWLEGDQFPTAHAVARLARAIKISEPLEPIYLHPPV